MKWDFSIKMAKHLRKRKRKKKVTKYENPFCLEFLNIFASKTMKRLFILILFASSARAIVASLDVAGRERR